jgi:hypothetical protein
MSEFTDTSSRAADQKIKHMGFDIANLYDSTLSLSRENKSMTIIVIVLIVIIVILLIIMYRVYCYTSGIEDLIYGKKSRRHHRSRHDRRGGHSGRYKAQYYDDTESDWETDDEW